MDRNPKLPERAGLRDLDEEEVADEEEEVEMEKEVAGAAAIVSLLSCRR